MGEIKALTFDLWDTIIIDDSDEAKRQAKGLPSKSRQRRILVREFLNCQEPISLEMVELAYDVTDAAFRFVWYGQCVTWTVAERLTVLLNGLRRELPQDAFDELVRLHEEMELEVMPDIIDGIAETLQSLKGHYKLGVISDAIFSPGRCLRELLKRYDLLHYFDHFVFSDEIECSKPDRKCFDSAAAGLGVELSELAHIGDRQEKDIAGPQNVGAKGILFPVIKDRSGANTTADAICTDYKDLPAILKTLYSK